MTTLYRPVLIETAEQADALPVGTVATLSEDIGDGVADFYAATKAEDGWERTDSSGPSWMSPAPATGMIGWTALVPIEAGTEYRPDTTAIRPWGETTPHPLPEQARYVTEWEDA